MSDSFNLLMADPITCSYQVYVFPGAGSLALPLADPSAVCLLTAVNSDCPVLHAK